MTTPPPLVDTHAHLDESPIDKSVQEDVGNRQFWLTGLIEILPTEMNGLDEEGARACVDYSLIELARTGTTTVLQMGGVEEYAADEDAEEADGDERRQHSDRLGEPVDEQAAARAAACVQVHLRTTTCAARLVTKVIARRIRPR